MELADLMPAGAARNALDCALWDLEAKLAGRRAWELAGLPEPPVLTTAYTLSLDTPETMGLSAAVQAARPLLKIKLAGDDLDVARVDAIRMAAPNATLIVDANEGAGKPATRPMALRQAMARSRRRAWSSSRCRQRTTRRCCGIGSSPCRSAPTKAFHTLART
jgi:L-Ala-D/L-Glu epimerase